ncbi:MAG: bifunctional demethylmenaquinone methyltransferase/2-methoxy-6-polyprenyl-1,4-benzoquinol methylase UbiE [Chitinophagaceae bacterium]|nr:MAG: bifunctional demethylmenaquinone methyltransferase/2-methoxy-6-polyprenyl-1,4-benzoquinol methylase UbiE [Chitinophagaceae bacterium]
MQNSLPHDSIKPITTSLKSKKQQVEEMFNNIAPKYDFMNHLLSIGIDVGWRKKAITLLKNKNSTNILDVATGTGDMAIMAAKLLDVEKITGIDLSENMLELGRKKIEKEGFKSKIELQKGDGETINFPDNSFDAVMVAFGVRNFEHLENGLREMQRVLKPGGTLVVLEFSTPQFMFSRKLYNLYMGIVAPEIARWFKQNKAAYKYLNNSANAFPNRKNFLSLLNTAGFINTHYKPLSLGICCIYTGGK